MSALFWFLAGMLVMGLAVLAYDWLSGRAYNRMTDKEYRAEQAAIEEAEANE